MDWVERFYSLKAGWLGESADIWPYERLRAQTIDRLCGPPPRRILELGAGSGGAAAAAADLGYDITAVELSSVRAGNARRLAGQPRPGSVTVVEGDFYAVDVGQGFDGVVYWDGFGVGTDAEQRRLLQRVATDWLASDGVALIEVFSPWAWAGDAGKERRNEARRVRGRIDFDPLICRFTETVWPDDIESQAVTQTIRCYTPADFIMLLGRTGLRVDRLESGQDEGDPIRLDVEDPVTRQHLLGLHSYLARLVRA